MKNPGFALALIAAFFLSADIGNLAAVAGDAKPPLPSSWILPQDEPIIFDLDSGTILGVVMGMDETMTRNALAGSGLPDVRRINYEDYFLLQACLGIVFNFRGGDKLNDIYTNSPNVMLSKGLRIGDSIRKFSAGLGEPSKPKRLPSNIGNEFIYKVADWELSVICVDKNPDIVAALSLRKPKQP